MAVTCAVFALALAWQTPSAAPSPRTDDPGGLPPSRPTKAAGNDGQARYWKGNLHTHSLWSDGDDFPEMIADWYKRHGYDFLAFSEHNVLAQGDRWVDVDLHETRRQAVAKYLERFGRHWPEFRTRDEKRQVRLKPLAEFRSLLEEPGRFLLIPAEEITHSYARRPIHINGINIRDVIRPVDGRDAAETIVVNLRQVAEQSKRIARPMLAFLNHPNFGWGVRAEDMLSEELRYFEVYNGHPAVRNYGDATHASCERIWDIILALRLGKLGLPVVYGLATDDAHGYHEFGVGKVNPGRGWTMVRSHHLTAESIVRAMLAGDFYSSTGVILDEIVRDGDTLRLTIRTEPGVTYRTEFIATLRDADLEATPVRDPNGNELVVTASYSADVGRVVATSDEPKPSYRLTGKELYVRAKVTSSRPHPNPYATGDRQVAWTQPVIP